jgi:hypothetical protein
VRQGLSVKQRVATSEQVVLAAQRPPSGDALTIFVQTAAIHALQRAIYCIDDVPEKVSSADVGQHVSAAALRDKVVPLSVCLILGKDEDGKPLSVCGAREVLARHPVLRTFVTALLAKAS